MEMVFMAGLGLSAVGICGLLWLWYRVRALHEARKGVERSCELLRQEMDVERRDALSALKEDLHRKRMEHQAACRKEQLELDKERGALDVREERMKSREQQIEERTRELGRAEERAASQWEQARSAEANTRSLQDNLVAKLEQISSLTRDEAKKLLMATIEDEARLASQKWLLKFEEDARASSRERAATILIDAMQRQVSDQVAMHAAGTIFLPDGDLKGRIIGKEGRNIKALEMATGMEFVLGEQPDSITISGFHPIRREVARRALERLIHDGRINPTKIEDTVAQCEREIDEIIGEHGRQIVADFNLRGLKDEVVTLLGKLHFRTSFSQNVLIHSIEVGRFARMIAEELDMPHPDIALRGGLLHDIGKALSAETEGPHAIIGAEVAKRCGEDPLVINAIAAHHEEVAFTSLYSPIVMIADTLSAARPGARRETFATYVKRLEKLEELAHGCDGVKKAYALQAGREIRVIVEEEKLSDDAAVCLARTIARKIEDNMHFPGQIKVNVIREKRAIEYAR